MSFPFPVLRRSLLPTTVRHPASVRWVGADGAAGGEEGVAPSAIVGLLADRFFCSSSVRSACTSVRVMQRRLTTRTIRFLTARSATPLRTQHTATPLSARTAATSGGALTAATSVGAFTSRAQHTAARSATYRRAPSSALPARLLSRPLEQSARPLPSAPRLSFLVPCRCLTSVAGTDPDQSLPHLMAQAAADATATPAAPVVPFKVRLYFVRHGESKMNLKTNLVSSTETGHMGHFGSVVNVADWLLFGVCTVGRSAQRSRPDLQR